MQRRKTARFWAVFKEFSQQSREAVFPLSSSVRPHVLYPVLGSLQYKKDMQLWDCSSRRVTNVVGRPKHRMFKEKLRELGLVSMKKEAVGDTTAT